MSKIDNQFLTMAYIEAKQGFFSSHKSPKLLLLMTNTLHAGKLFQQTHFDIFFLFFPRIGSDSSCKLSPQETICMKCQVLFSRNKIARMALYHT